MAVKTTGVEFKKFYHDPEFWPEDSWIEDIELLVDGERNESAEDDVDTIPDTSKVTIEAGFVVLDSCNTPSLESFFKKWRKAQTTVSFVVECHKDHAEGIKAGIKMMGGTVK